MKLPLFAFETGRSFGEHLRGQRVLVACSGGVDSVALADVLARLAPRFGFSIAIAHIHHGPGEQPQSQSRDRARDFVRGLARAQNFEFFERKSLAVLKGEEALRDFRKLSIDEIVEQNGFTKVALGHHADDLLETRLIRLVRGTGPRGLIAMKASTARVLRPFLTTSREHILNYARAQKLAWIEDPSNDDRNFLRNWMRHEWLPILEKNRPGSRAALARSLDLLCEAVPLVTKSSPIQSRSDFHKFPPPKKRATIAAIAIERGARNFGSAKIIEVLKRLDRLEVSRQKRANFVVGGVEWNVTHDTISAKADAGPRS
jgi:tRNA(Ile)-lysidine synthase